MNKKKVLVSALVVGMLACVSAGTLAYFTAEETAHNIITSGKIDITLNDDTIAEDGTTIDFPEAGISGVMPGVSVDKLVSVTNNGGNDAWVRIRLETTIVGADGNALPTELTDGSDAIIINFNKDTKWAQGEDGLWYYTEKLTADAETDRLFETVTFAPQLGNEYQNCTANVIVYAEAVQTANNGTTWDEAAGWPTTAEEGE